MTPREAVSLGTVADRSGRREPWRTHSARMAARLFAEGHIQDPRWRDAFADTPRHLLLPETDAVSASGDDAPDWWLDAVYSETSHGPGTDRRPIVAPSQPTSAVLAWLLSLLVSDGDGTAGSSIRVLEVGAGYGYATALLCHRLGAEQVTATEPLHADQTRARLATLDLFPCLVAAEDVRGASAYGPFDAILCATGPRTLMLPARLGQLADGGRIVAAVRGADGQVAANLFERAECGASVRLHVVSRERSGTGAGAL